MITTKTLKRATATVALVILATGLSACATNRGTDTALGAVGGGAAGALLGGGVLGTAAGAAAGGLIGNQIGK